LFSICVYLCSSVANNVFARSVLHLRRQLQPSEIAQALGEMFQKVLGDAQRNGVALAGPPFARYLEMTHAGPYDKLHEAHAAIQQWIAAEGLTAAGAPWESYVTDPADSPVA
jgi:AraC family transcriptional regulator